MPAQPGGTPLGVRGLPQLGRGSIAELPSRRDGPSTNAWGDVQAPVSADVAAAASKSPSGGLASASNDVLSFDQQVLRRRRRRARQLQQEDSSASPTSPAAATTPAERDTARDKVVIATEPDQSATLGSAASSRRSDANIDRASESGMRGERSRNMAARGIVSSDPRNGGDCSTLAHRWHDRRHDTGPFRDIRTRAVHAAERYKSEPPIRVALIGAVGVDATVAAWLIATARSCG